MANRFIIGKGELLTYPIEAPGGGGEKDHPYTLTEAKTAIIPAIVSAAQEFDSLPPAACPLDMAVAKLTLHPSYIAKSFFPAILLRNAGLTSVGSRTVSVQPRTENRKRIVGPTETSQLFVAGNRKAFWAFASFAGQLTEATPDALNFAEIEQFSAMTAEDRIRPLVSAAGDYFEVGLHLLPDTPTEVVREPFKAFAAECGFEVISDLEFQAGRLLFLPLRGSASELKRLADFTMLRVARPMPSMRGVRPVPRNAQPEIVFQLPVGDPLSREPKVAILDGGLPSEHPLSNYIGRYFKADEAAADAPDYVDHGLGVTSAFLFGPIEPGTPASRPYAFVDHHRVLDAQSDKEDPLELYRTLAHIETVLLSRQYQFLNLSLGPDLSIDDSDVHAWTAVIDSLLSNGETLMTVAVGNNGERDAALGFNRVQVPADCVNALSVGASSHSGKEWDRATYSACGPGRTPGKRKPDIVAFGGSPQQYFHVATEGKRPTVTAKLGTSFAAPLALRSAVGIRAVLGNDVHPLTIKALLVHGCECLDPHLFDEIGWGRVPTDLNTVIMCPDGVARIIYQGELKPGKFLRAPVPLPLTPLVGKVKLSATFCYASPTDPQDASAYTKAGLIITFRPHQEKKVKSKNGKTAKYAKSTTFFPLANWRTEAEQRADLGKWETVLHGTNSYLGSTLSGSTFDIHYNARDGGMAVTGAERIRYALVLTLEAPKNVNLYDDVLAAHAVLRPIEPQISIPLRI